MQSPLSFMTRQHHAVRNFVVMQMPLNHGHPIRPAKIADSLNLKLDQVVDLLDDLERHLFFLVRDGRGNVSWAFPVTSDRTPHRLLFSTGQHIYAACGEDSIAAPFVESRLHKQQLQVEISTSCAHCGRGLHIMVDHDLRVRVRERDADPRVFLPHIDWSVFRGKNIIDAY